MYSTKYIKKTRAYLGVVCLIHCLFVLGCNTDDTANAEATSEIKLSSGSSDIALNDQDLAFLSAAVYRDPSRSNITPGTFIPINFQQSTCEIIVVLDSLAQDLECALKYFDFKYKKIKQAYFFHFKYKEVKGINIFKKFLDPKNFVHADVKGMLLHTENENGTPGIAFVFRGTSSKLHFIANAMGYAKFPLKNTLNKEIKVDVNARNLKREDLRDLLNRGIVRAHTGFLLTFNTFWYQLVRDTPESTLRQLFPKGPELYVTGHSLGAAYGQLLGTFVRMNQLADPNFPIQNNIQTISLFGPPRVGNKNFAYWYGDKLSLTNKTKLYLNDWDIVTYLGPTFQDYIHTGIMVAKNSQYNGGRFEELITADQQREAQLDRLIDKIDERVIAQYERLNQIALNDDDGFSDKQIGLSSVRETLSERAMQTAASFIELKQYSNKRLASLFKNRKVANIGVCAHSMKPQKPSSACQFYEDLNLFDGSPSNTTSYMEMVGFK